MNKPTMVSALIVALMAGGSAIANAAYYVENEIGNYIFDHQRLPYRPVDQSQEYEWQVPFYTGKYKLGPLGQKSLKDMIPELKKTQVITIQGRPDPSDPDNSDLAYRRALAMKAYLLKNGLKDKEINVNIVREAKFTADSDIYASTIITNKSVRPLEAPVNVYYSQASYTPPAYEGPYIRNNRQTEFNHLSEPVVAPQQSTPSSASIAHFGLDQQGTQVQGLVSPDYGSNEAVADMQQHSKTTNIQPLVQSSTPTPKPTKPASQDLKQKILMMVVQGQLTVEDALQLIAHAGVPSRTVESQPMPMIAAQQRSQKVIPNTVEYAQVPMGVGYGSLVPQQFTGSPMPNIVAQAQHNMMPGGNVWQIDATKTLSENLTDWARQSGWTIEYRASDFSVASTQFAGTFPEVLENISLNAPLNICASDKTKNIKITNNGTNCR